MVWPFENDTSAVEKQLADRSLAANRRRNSLAGIIILSASFLLNFTTILLCNATIYSKITYEVNNTNEVLISIVGISFILLCTAGLTVKNIFYVSVLQRTHEFAKLRTIGATYRQIVSVMNGERKLLTCKFMILGLFIGFFCNIVLPMKFYMLPSIACALFSGVFIWFVVYCSFRTPVKIAASVSPMDAVRQVNEIPVNRSKMNGRITPGGLGKRYFLSHHKKAFYTLTSLTLSGVLMFIVFTLMSAINIEKIARQPYRENSDLYIQLNSDPKHLTYDLMKNSPFTSELHQKISSIPGVENIYTLKMLNCKIYNSDTGKNIDLAIESILNEANLKNSIIEGNVPVYHETFHAIPVVVNRTSYYYEKSGLMLSIGDNLKAHIDTGYSNQSILLEVCGFIEDKDDGVVLYTNKEYLDSIAEMNCDLIWYVCAEKSHTESVVSEVQALMSQDSRVYISILEDDIAFYKTAFHNSIVVISVLTILVSLFAFVNLLNTCITNTIVRSHDYALLEAVGMTKTQISNMQSTEHFIYFAGSFIGSCILGIPLGVVICNRIAQISGISYISYRFPVAFLILYGIFIIAAYNIVSFYQKRLFAKQSVVELLINSF